jgi:hypothetical protein
MSHLDSGNDIKIVLSVDTDSDQYIGDRAGPGNINGKAIIGWKGLDKGKDLLADCVREVSDDLGINIPLTWFVRCDRQVETYHQDAAYLLKEYEPWWLSRQDFGDELQWHAHLYRNENGFWKQESEPEQLAEDLEIGLTAFKQNWNTPSAIRIGENYHSNELMSILDRMGLPLDSTALPGRNRQDEEKSIDWTCTPNHPYIPSEEDYRIAGKPECSIWEVPLNTVPTKVAYDNQPILRYINPAFQVGVIDQGLAQFFRNHKVLTCVTHPFELVPDFFSDSHYSSHPLVAFNAHAFSSNLKTIVEIAKSQGRFRFVTISQLLKELKNSSV